MKKLFVCFVSLFMVFSLVACGDKGTSEVDMSKYPSDVNAWTAEDFNNYFTDLGVYEEEDWIYVQDHATYYDGTVIDTCGGYMNDDGDVFTGVFIVDEDNEDAEDFINYCSENKKMTEDLGSFPIDHQYGKYLFVDSYTVDEDQYNAFEDAFSQWAKDVGVEFEY